MTKRLFLKDSGIYQTRNLITNDAYIGQTIELSTRRYGHFRLLAEGKHHNPILQNSYNKYGKDNFLFEVLLFCDIDKLDHFEQLLINIHKPRYNIRKDATSNRGHKTTDETKRKISDAQKGRKFSEEHRNNISVARKGKKLSLSADTIEKMKHRMTGNQINLGRKQTQEEKDKRAKSIRRFWSEKIKIVPEYVGRKISQSLLSSPKALRGEKNHKSKLKEEDVRNIRNWDAEKLYERKIMAKMFGVSRTIIDRVCARRVWKHVP